MSPKGGFSSARVLVVGDIALDRYIYGEVGRISPEAPVPVLKVRSTQHVPGCAANVAANVAALGAHATLIGVTGRDSAADELAAAVAALRYPFEMRTIVAADRPTTLKARFIAAGQQIMRADEEEIRPLDPALENRLLEAIAEALPEHHVVAVSDYAKGTLTDRVLHGLLAQANAAGKPVVVDPKRVDFSAYRGATLIKPNRIELRAASGLPCESDAEAGRAADAVIAATGAMILLTRSEKGMSLFRPGAEPVHRRTEARQIFDVAGAGDTVAAAVAVALAAGLDGIEAMRLANAAAGVVVAKRGTATVTSAELDAALASSQRGFEGRLLSRDEAISQRETWRRQGLRCGFTNGCFDLIHPGHISLLRQAKATCDRLIVALNSDASIRRLKGPARPLQGEEARAYVMAHIEHVDGVVVFDEDTPLELITALRPDVLVKGADYREDEVVGGDVVKSYGGKVVLAELVPNQSTSRLVKRGATSSA